MKEKYFTPDISEIHVGYEIEWKSKIRNQDWEKTICDVDLISIIYDEFEHSDFEELFDEQFRTSYLTKEQIEKEGWNFKFNMIDLWFEKEISFEKVSQNPCRATLHYNLNDKFMFIYLHSYEEEIHIFQGKIKCINEFRNILKYLCINT